MRTAPLARALLEASPDAVVIVDTAGSIVALNPIAEHLLGYEPGELVGRSVDDLVGSGSRARHAVARAGYGGRRRRMSDRPDLQAERKDGTTFTVQVSLTPIDGEGLLIAAVLRDVSELRRLTRETMRWAHLFEHIELGVVIARPDGTIDMANPAFERMHGRRVGSGRGSQFTDAAAPRLAAGSARNLAQTERLGHHRWETTHVRADGSEFPVAVDATAATDEWSGEGHLLVVVKDITARRAAEAHLSHLASHDELTGLANRTLLLDTTRAALAAADGRRHVAILFADLDQFKMVNDSIGHSAGDALIVALSRRLVGILPEGATAARPGGDEFVFLLPDLPGPPAEAEAQARQVAEQLLASLAEPFEVEGRRIHATMSIGIALATEDSAAPAELLRDADAAMYRAKAAGRGIVDVFDHALRARTLRRVELEAELRAGLARGEFLAYFQPIVELGSGEAIGAEALVRWEHPQRGLLLPAAFLDVAEDAGLIVAIGRQVLEDAARAVDRWRAVSGRDVYVSVNVAAGQLGMASFPEDIRSLLDRFALPASALRLEVTENTLLLEDGLDPVLASLLALGVGLGLDDFGTGYGSLTHLLGSGATYLKLDRRFVELVDASPIAEAVVKLGLALGLDVIAEGIERPEQAAQLAAYGCRYGQGFLYSRAIPAADLAPRFAAPGAG